MNFDEAIKKGIEGINNKDYPAAIAAFNQAIQYNPNNVAIHNNLAGLYFYVDDYEHAKFHWQKILEIDPDCQFAGDARNNLLAVEQREAELNRKIGKFKDEIENGTSGSASLSLSMDEWKRLHGG